MSALWWGIGIAAGVGVIGGILLLSSEETKKLGETGSIPEVDPNKTVLGRDGKKPQRQRKNVLRWAPKIRTAILENTEVPEDKRVFYFQSALAFIDQESMGDPRATSYEREGANNASGEFKRDANGKKIALAKGLGQFIDGTSKRYGVKNAYHPDDIIPGMIRFMVDLFEEAKGDPAGMAQGYYSGIGHTDRDIDAAIAAKKAKGKSTKGLQLTKNYMGYHMRLMDLYGNVT